MERGVSSSLVVTSAPPPLSSVPMDDAPSVTPPAAPLLLPAEAAGAGCVPSLEGRGAAATAAAAATGEAVAACAVAAEMQEETEADEEVDVAEERRLTLLSASGDAPGGMAPVGISPHSLSMRQSTWSVDICSHVDEVASKSDDEFDGVKREASPTGAAPKTGLAVADSVDAASMQLAV